MTATAPTVPVSRPSAAGARGPGNAAFAPALAHGASTRRAVLLGLAAALALAAEPAAPGPHVDREGFPLPAEALARVGSGRFRHGRELVNLDYSPDGKLLASSGRGLVRIWDAGTGKPVQRFSASEVRYAKDGLFSADGKTVVVLDDQTYRWLDVCTGTEVRACPFKFPNGGHTARLGARGTLLAVADEQPGKDLVVYELPSGRERFRRTAAAQWFGEVAFSPDGTTLAALEWVNPALKGNRVHFFDTATGRPLGAFDPGDTFRGLSFSRDGKKLLAHDFKEHVTVWGVPTGEVLHRFEVRVNALTTAAFAPDGKSVVAGSQDLDAVQIELATGKELHRFRVYPSSTSLAFTADGRRLAVGVVDGDISQWDFATGRRLDASADAVMGFRPLRFDATGRVLELWNDALTAVEWRTGREAWRMPVPDGGIGYQAAVSPDRSRVAGVTADKKMAVWDTGSGKLLCVFPNNNSVWSTPAFSPDGRTLYAGDWNGPVHAWDASTGRELPAFDKGRHFARSLALSRDGRWLAAADNPQMQGGGRREILIWDRGAGGEPRRLLLHPEAIGVWALAFSPDGSRLAAVGGDPFGWKAVPGKEGFVSVWDVATGEEKFVCLALVDELTCVDYSADGRLLVTGGRDRAVRLWEVATGQERHHFTGHESQPYRVAFSPDGKLVASAAPDAPVFVWDVEGCYGKPPSAVPFADREARALWDALDNADAAAAFGAMRQMLARTDPAAALLRDRLRPVPETDRKILRRLLGELDADDFATREKASKDLEALADRAEAALRKALAEKPSAETRRRIRQILEAAAPGSAGRRREVRAVEVLERLGTARARELLVALAGGDKDALLTREARAALGRLAGH